MKTQTLGFIGGGRITKIFLQAFKNQSVLFDSIKVFDTNKEVLNALKNDYHEIEISDSATAPARQEIVIISVHPPVEKNLPNPLPPILHRQTRHHQNHRNQNRQT